MENPQVIKSSQTPLCFGNARFTVYAQGAVRLEYREQRNFPPTPSILTAPTLPPPLSAEVEQPDEKTIVLKTDLLTLTFINDGKPFSRDNLTIVHPQLHGKNQWSPGDVDEPLVSMLRSCDVWVNEQNFSREEHPGMLDLQGRACIVDKGQVYRSADNAWVEVTTLPLRGQDWWFFGYGSDFAGALRDFVAVFGRIPLIPRWSFGFWYSKWFEFSQDDIVAIAQKYRSRGLPMDVMVVDTEWREQGWVGYNWHPERFPNPQKMMKELKDMGLAITFNDHPSYDKVEDSMLPDNDRLLPAYQQVMGEPPWRGVWSCNWHSRKSVEAWKSLVLSKAFEEGMDFWWVDGWGESPFRGITGQFWMNRHYFEIAEKMTGKRGMILSRWGGWGSHRYPVQFSGDTHSDWTTLDHQIRFTVDSCGAGATYWSHDIGGFNGKIISDDLYIRWIQFGALSPIFRTHSAFGSREPFEYSDAAQKVFKQMVFLRYALVPCFYHYAREMYDTGLPLCRPMYLHHPENQSAYSNRNQYFLGRDILVVPVSMPGDTVTRTFWVPEGTWIRPQTNEVMYGNSQRTITVPLNEIPVLYRRGSIVPHQEVAMTTREKALDPLHLDIYPDRCCAAELDFYEDDGETNGYMSDQWARTAMSAVRRDNTVTVTIEQPRGRYAEKLPFRRYVLNVWLDQGEVAQEVSINNKKISSDDWRISHEYAAGSCTGKASFVRIFCPHSSETTVAVVTLG